MTEIWVSIPIDIQGYEASSLGRIRSYRKSGPAGGLKPIPSILRPSDNGNGYLYVSTGRNKPRGVHALICTAFYGPPPLGREAAHLNGNRQDNRPENLVWATRSENHCHKRQHGTSLAGERNHRAILSEREAVEIRKMFSGGLSVREIATTTGAKYGTIYQVAKNLRWKHLQCSS